MSTRALRRGNIARSGSLFSPVAATGLSLPGISGNYGSTPDSVANSLTTVLDLRIKATLPDWNPGSTKTLVAKFVTTGGQRSWALNMLTNTLRFSRSTDGVDSGTATSGPHGISNGTTMWVRVTFRTTPSAEVRFFTSSDGSSWVQKGTAVTSLGTTPMFDSMADIEIGSLHTGTAQLVSGDIHNMVLRNGIDPVGSVVQSFDATAVTKVGTRDPSTVAAGGPWTINGTAWDWAV